MNKKIPLLNCLLLMLLIQSDAQAADPMVQLAAEKGCFICHAVTPDPDVSRPLAPSYQDIANRYKELPAGFNNLVDRIMHGTAYTKQNWEGKVSMRFMPPNVNVTRSEAAALLHWILQDESSSESSAKHTEKLALATNAGCMTCHTVDPGTDRHSVPLAPSFREIANRYAGQKESRTRLILAVQQGTAAREKTWHKANMRFMPPNPQLRDEDAYALVDWILTLKQSH